MKTLVEQAADYITRNTDHNTEDSSVERDWTSPGPENAAAHLEEAGKYKPGNPDHHAHMLAYHVMSANVATARGNHEAAEHHWRSADYHINHVPTYEFMNHQDRNKDPRYWAHNIASEYKLLRGNTTKSYNF